MFEKSKKSFRKTLIILISAMIFFFGIFGVDINKADAESRISISCLTSSVSYSAFGMPAYAKYELNLYKMDGYQSTLVKKHIDYADKYGRSSSLVTSKKGTGTYMVALHVRSGKYEYANAWCY